MAMTMEINFVKLSCIFWVTKNMRVCMCVCVSHVFSWDARDAMPVAEPC